MEAESESVLLINWIENSGILTSTDYAFLTNLYLEVIHLAEQLPPTPYGEELKRDLLRKGSQISNQIDELEYHIDAYMGEFFEATVDEIYEDTGEWEDNKEYRQKSIKQRQFEITYRWEVINVEGPIGKIKRGFTYDFSYDEAHITSAIEDWIEGLDWISDIDLDTDIEGAHDYDDNIEVEFYGDGLIRGYTITVSVSLHIEWEGDDNYNNEPWEEY